VWDSSSTYLARKAGRYANPIAPKLAPGIGAVEMPPFMKARD